MSWGHPETTGSESIDFFLCSKDLISENSEKFYSEKFLIKFLLAPANIATVFAEASKSLPVLK